MFDIKSIVESETLDEAILKLSSNPNLRIIAGGTDILIGVRHGKWESVELLSLSKLDELKGVWLLEDGTISIGARSTFSMLHRNEIVNKYIPVLADAVVTIGGPQIRNIATIGGNVCNGAVSADSASTLFAYNARLRFISKAGERVVKIQDFYEGPGKVKILPGEILTDLLIAKEDYIGFNGHYIKYCTRKALDIAMLGVSVISKTENGRFKDLRIALGVAAPTPVRCTEAEEYASGKEVTDEVIKEIGRLAVKASKARDSWRAAKSYREHLIEILSQRAIKEAITKAGGEVIE
jgi:xanthine dehydrogenase FAD-binding subunit